MNETSICDTIADFGFLINHKMRSLVPSKQTIWLWLLWDNKPSYCFSPERVAKLHTCLKPIEWVTLKDYLHHRKLILGNWKEPHALCHIPALTGFSKLLTNLPKITPTLSPLGTMAVDATPLNIVPQMEVLSDNQATIASFKNGFSSNLAVNKLFQAFLTNLKNSGKLMWPKPPKYIVTSKNPADAPSHLKGEVGHVTEPLTS
ncbi:hypothetical protein HMI56_004157 [Coelomomyces lativittatus]|nr:hypothetical protein HMI56_004157 [Coelomomyces lativittatus]